MKQIQFDKCCKGVANYIYLNKWYDVVSEGTLTYKIMDESQTVNAYPKTWITHMRQEAH